VRRASSLHRREELLGLKEKGYSNRRQGERDGKTQTGKAKAAALGEVLIEDKRYLGP
jgi:hypothetical protein